MSINGIQRAIEANSFLNYLSGCNDPRAALRDFNRFKLSVLVNSPVLYQKIIDQFLIQFATFEEGRHIHELTHSMAFNPRFIRLEVVNFLCDRNMHAALKCLIDHNIVHANKTLKYVDFDTQAVFELQDGEGRKINLMEYINYRISQQAKHLPTHAEIASAALGLAQSPAPLLHQYPAKPGPQDGDHWHEATYHGTQLDSSEEPEVNILAEKFRVSH